MTEPGPRILIVEDDEDDILFLKRAFHRVGLPLPLVVVADGDAAVVCLSGVGNDRATRPTPDFVLLDLKLPKRSGIEVLRWMRASPLHAHRPVIIFTSSNQPEDRATCERLGVDAYLVKPVGFGELEAAAREVMRIWGIIPLAVEGR